MAVALPISSLGSCLEGDPCEGDEETAHGHTHDHPGPHDGLEIHQETESAHEEGGDRQAGDAPCQEVLGVHLDDEARHDRHHEHRREAARSQGQPREGGAISHHLLGEEGKEDERAEQGDKGEEDDYVANGEGTVAEDPQVYHRVVGTKLDDDEKGQGNGRDDGQPDDQVGREPILPLPLVEQHLEASEANHEEGEAPGVDLHLRLLDIGGIDDEERRHG